MHRSILVLILAILLFSSTVYPIRLNDAFGSDAFESFSPKLSGALIEKIATTTGDIPVLIEAYSQPYTSISDDVLRLGGRVTFEYKYVAGLAASLAAEKIEFLAQNPNIKRISLDMTVVLPEESLEGLDLALYTGLSQEEFFPVSFEPEDLLAGDFDLDGDVDITDAFTLLYSYGAQPGDAGWNPSADLDRDGDVDLDDAATFSVLYQATPRIQPSNYINSAISGVTQALLTSSGFGEDTIIAIMDTGINTRHFLLSRPGMVVGGVDLSCDAINHTFCTPARTGFPGFDRFENQFHGSFVASVAAGSGAVALLATSVTVRAIELYTGTTLPPGPPDAMGRPTKIVPLSGIAPKAQLYIVKVFDHTGLGISESLVIQGIEHIIDKRLVDGLDIDVVNMSLGGATLFDGRDLLDKAADAATAAGLTMVLAAGNEGPAPMTVASAGSANTVVTVGAAVNPVHIRVFRDNQLGTLGIGAQLHGPDTQVAAFSSRGPTSDGRGKPDLVAAGTTLLAAFAERTNTGLAFGSGTSFSTPGVAGAIALLNSFAEKNGLSTTPFDYKQAVIASANTIPGWTVEEQGAGFLNTAGALAALQSDPVLGDAQAPIPEDGELFDITNISEASPGKPAATFSFPGITLAPSKARDFVFAIHDMESITVRISNVDLGANNPLGMNSFEIYLKNSRRTSSLSDYHVFGANVFGDATFTVVDDATTFTGEVRLPPCIGAIRVPPCATGRQIDAITTRPIVIQPGFYKVRIENDFTSGDILSADLTIEYVKAGKASPDVSISGTLKQGQFTGFIPISVPAGTRQAIIEVSFVHDWSVYPTADLDLFIVNGTKLVTRGATLNAPEHVVINNPADDLAVGVEAFTISQGTPGAASEPFTITVKFVS